MTSWSHIFIPICFFWQWHFHNFYIGREWQQGHDYMNAKQNIFPIFFRFQLTNVHSKNFLAGGHMKRPCVYSSITVHMLLHHTHIVFVARFLDTWVTNKRLESWWAGLPYPIISGQSGCSYHEQKFWDWTAQFVIDQFNVWSQSRMNSEFSCTVNSCKITGFDLQAWINHKSVKPNYQFTLFISP